MVKTLTLGAFVGLALGVFATILTVVLMSVLAFTQSSRFEIPGVFSVWPDDSSGAQGLAFMPNFVGIALVVVGIAVVCAALAAYGRRRVVSR